MEKWRGKVGVVTGAGSGIGAAIAEAFTQAGIQVIGLARSKERLDKVGEKLGKSFHAVKCDVTLESDIVAAFASIKENFKTINILINAAGCIVTENLYDISNAGLRRVIDTNLTGLCLCTREAITMMTQNGENAQIININSIVGHHITPYPKANIYPATKFAVTAATEVLRNEMTYKKSKIKVTSLSPGMVDTEMMEHADIPKMFVDRIRQENPLLNVKDVADAALYVLSTPETVQIQELIIKPRWEAF